MDDKTFYSRVSPKDQITLPAEFRKELGLKPKDQVTLQMEDGVVQIRPLRSRLLKHYQKAGALKQPLSWKEIEEIAHEDHAVRAAQEGLESVFTTYLVPRFRQL